MITMAAMKFKMKINIQQMKKIAKSLKMKTKFQMKKKKLTIMIIINMSQKTQSTYKK